MCVCVSPTPERRLRKLELFDPLKSCVPYIACTRAYFPLLGNGRAQGQELMKALVQLHPISASVIAILAADTLLTRALEAPRVLGPGGTNILSG